MVVPLLWIWAMFKGKEKVRVPKHVIHVEKLDMFPKTVGIASQRVLDLHPLARAQAQKAHPPVREPKVQRDLQRGKANRPKEKVKARWDPSLESSTQLRAKRKLNSGLKSLKQKARRLGMKKHGQTKIANGIFSLFAGYLRLAMKMHHMKHQLLKLKLTFLSKDCCKPP